MTIKDKLTSMLDGKWENHTLPFFWQHGEEDEVLIEELITSTTQAAERYVSSPVPTRSLRVVAGLTMYA